MANPFKSIEKKIKRSIESLGNDVKRAIKSTGDEVRGSVEWAGNNAKKSINDLAHKAEADIKKVADDLEDDLEEAAETALKEAKDAATAAARAALAEISAGALNKVVDAMQILMPSATSLSLGPFVLAIDDWTDRVDTLQKWASKPPSTKNDIRAIIEEIAPSSVSINLSFSLAFLVVQTDSLEFGVENTYETADFLDKFDALLSHYGINI